MHPAVLVQPTELILCRIRAEYWEVPGLKLTPAQAQRLLGLDPGSCDKVLVDLVADGFMLRTRDGAFVLRDRSSVA
jgi:hypothetical protein